MTDVERAVLLDRMHAVAQAPRVPLRRVSPIVHHGHLIMIAAELHRVEHGWPAVRRKLEEINRR